MADSLPAFLERRDSILRQILALGDFRSGSITTTSGKCGKPNCHCHQPDSPGHGPNHRLTRKQDGKTVTETFSSPAELRKARAEVEAFHRFQSLSRELLEVNEEICKARPVEDTLTPQEKKTALAIQLEVQRELDGILRVLFQGWRKEGRLDLESAETAIRASMHRAAAAALGEAFAARFAQMGDHESGAAPGSTTHFSVVDRHGNFCAVTQTLLSIFGSRVVSPSTGVLLNNGIMWFDPVPGRPNSLAPGKRCLANYCPVVGRDAAGRMFALGASGGRKILGAVLQLAMFVSRFGMTLEQAFHQPRIDVSGLPSIAADPHLGRAVLDAVAQVMPVVESPRVVFPYAFACPAGVLRDGGMNSGCTEIMSPYGDAAAEDEARIGAGAARGAAGV